MTQPSSTDVDASTQLRDVVGTAIRHIKGMWRYRWSAIGIAWVVAALGTLVVYSLPNTFQAQARVFVDADNVLRPLLNGLSVETNVMSDVMVMSRTLVTRPNLERVARATDLDLRAKTKADFEALLRSLEARIMIDGSRENIFTIGFIDKDRDMAVKVVDNLLDTFVEDTLGTGQEDSKQAEQTLRTEIDDYERRMVESEDRLKEFKRANVGLMPNEYGGYYEQLQRATSERAAVQQQVRIAQQKLAALDRQLLGEEPVFGIMSSTGAGAGSPFDLQISTLESNLAKLMVEYTDKHPEVLRTQSLLEELRAKRDQYRAQRPAMASSTNPLDVNPVYQNLKIQHSTVEVELASLRAQLKDKQAEVKRLQEAVDVIPQVEAELNRLNRDYEVVRTRYTAMLGRWEDLQTAQRVQTGAEPVRFRIVDPPFAALRPVGPNRPLFMALVLMLSLGAGLGVAFARNLIAPVFMRARELSAFNIPILGSVSQTWSAMELERKRRENFGLVGAVAALLIVIGVSTIFADRASDMLRALI